MKKRITAAVLTAILLMNTVVICFANEIDSFKVSRKTSELLSRGGAQYTLYEGSYDKNGVSYKVRAHSVIAKLGSGTDIDITSGNSLYGRSSLSSKLASYSAAENTKVIAGMNAGFFSFETGLPMGLQIRDYRLEVSNDFNIDNTNRRYSIGFKEDGTAVFGIPQFEISVDIDGNKIKPNRINAYPNSNFVLLLTSDYADKSYWDKTVGHDVVVIKADGQMRANSKLVGTYEQYFENITEPIELADGYYYLISNTGNTALKGAVEGKNQGDRAAIEILEKTGEWADVKTAFSGGNLLVKDGALFETGSYDSAISRVLTSRSAIGIKNDGSVVIYTVERDKDGLCSSGIYLDALAQAMLDLGCKYALNLDGGGSSTLGATVENQGVVIRNNLQEGRERAVSNCVVLISEEYPPAIVEDFESEQIIKEKYSGRNLINAAIINKNAYTGKLALKLEYKLATNGVVGVELDLAPNISDASFISFAIKGDMSGNILEAVYSTPYGDVNQEICTLDFEGYRRISVDAQTATTLKGFNIRNKSNDSKKGEIYIDRIVSSRHFPIDDEISPEIETTFKDNIFTANVTDGIYGSGVDSEGATIRVGGKLQKHTYNGGILNVEMPDITNETVSLAVTEVCDVVGNRARDISLIKSKDDVGFSTFFDVQSGKWDSDYIRYCFENSFISGIPEKEGLMFKGTNNITRTEFCVMLVSRTGIDVSKYTNVELPYKDADSIPSWAILYVKAAYAEKIMVGGGENFNPDANITRAEAASASVNITKIDDRLSKNIVFADKDQIPQWASEDIKTATNQCIFKGNEKGEFRPSGLLTRSEAAVIMTNIMR